MILENQKYFWLLFTGILLSLFSCDTAPKGTPQVSYESHFDSINAVIKGNPNNASLYGHRGDLRVEEGEMENALSDYNRAIELDSLNDEWYVRKAEALIQMKEIGRAKNFLDKSIYTVPGSVRIMLLTSKIYLWAGDFQQCINWANAALAFDPYVAEAYYLKGMSHKSTNDTAKAVSNFRTAVEQDAGHYASYVQLGQLFSLVDHPLAMSYFENAVSVRPNSTEAMYALGLEYQKNEKIEDAKLVYNKILTEDSSYYKARYNLGYVYLILEENIDSAMWCFENVISIAPDYADAHYNLGYCRELKGNELQAIETYRFVLTIDPQHTLAAKGLNRLSK